jgi:hypothetical protein
MCHLCRQIVQSKPFKETKFHKSLSLLRRPLCSFFRDYGKNYGKYLDLKLLGPKSEVKLNRIYMIVQSLKLAGNFGDRETAFVREHSGGSRSVDAQGLERADASRPFHMSIARKSKHTLLIIQFVSTPAITKSSDCNSHRRKDTVFL